MNECATCSVQNSNVAESINAESNITLYSTGCPRCMVLKKKMDEKGIKYNIVSDQQYMMDKGFSTVPILEIDDQIMNFSEAINWINKEI